MTSSSDDAWTLVVTSRSSWINFNLGQIWKYRDLLLLFVKRDIITVYKQTVLGPLWYFIQPILTTIMFTIVFGRIAKLSTDGLPPVLFYLSGIIVWNYFAECFKTTSDSFTKNEEIFGKVYFPRVIIPMSVVLSNLVKFVIQFLLFLGIFAYYLLQGTPLVVSGWVLLVPLLIAMVAGLSLGFGMIISSLTTKYRDLSFLIVFGIQLAMYATPVIYPLSEAPEKYRLFLPSYSPQLNLIERFWKFVKKQCLRNEFYETFNAFQTGIADFIEHAEENFRKELDTLLSWKFQTFTNVQLLAG